MPSRRTRRDRRSKKALNSGPAGTQSHSNTQSEVDTDAETTNKDGSTSTQQDNSSQQAPNLPLSVKTNPADDFAGKGYADDENSSGAPEFKKPSDIEVLAELEGQGSDYASEKKLEKASQGVVDPNVPRKSIETKENDSSPLSLNSKPLPSIELPKDSSTESVTNKTFHQPDSETRDLDIKRKAKDSMAQLGEEIIGDSEQVGFVMASESNDFSVSSPAGTGATSGMGTGKGFSIFENVRNIFRETPGGGISAPSPADYDVGRDDDENEDDDDMVDAERDINRLRQYPASLPNPGNNIYNTVHQEPLQDRTPSYSISPNAPIGSTSRNSIPSSQSGLSAQKHDGDEPSELELHENGEQQLPALSSLFQPPQRQELDKDGKIPEAIRNAPVMNLNDDMDRARSPLSERKERDTRELAEMGVVRHRPESLLDLRTKHIPKEVEAWEEYASGHPSADGVKLGCEAVEALTKKQNHFIEILYTVSHQRNKLSRQADQLRHDNDELLASKNPTHEGYEKELNRLEDKVNEKEEALNNFEWRSNTLFRDIKDVSARLKLKQKSKVIEEAKEEVERQKSEQEILKQQNEKFSKEKDKLDEEHSIWKTEAEKIRQERNALKEQNKNLISLNQKLAAEKERLQEQNQEAEKTVIDLRGALDNCESRYTGRETVDKEDSTGKRKASDSSDNAERKNYEENMKRVKLERDIIALRRKTTRKPDEKNSETVAQKAVSEEKIENLEEMDQPAMSQSLEDVYATIYNLTARSDSKETFRKGCEQLVEEETRKVVDKATQSAEDYITELEIQLEHAHKDLEVANINAKTLEAKELKEKAEDGSEILRLNCKIGILQGDIDRLKKELGDVKTDKLLMEEELEKARQKSTKAVTIPTAQQQTPERAITLAILRCENYLKAMRDNRAKFGPRDGDADDALAVAAEALEMSHIHSKDALTGRSHFWLGVARFYDHNLVEAGESFLASLRYTAWKEPIRERRILEEWSRHSATWDIQPGSMREHYVTGKKDLKQESSSQTLTQNSCNSSRSKWPKRSDTYEVLGHIEGNPLNEELVRDDLTPDEERLRPEKEFEAALLMDNFGGADSEPDSIDILDVKLEQERLAVEENAKTEQLEKGIEEP